MNILKIFLIKKLKTVITKAKPKDKIQDLIKKSFKNNHLQKYKISLEILKNYFKSKLSKKDFKNIELFIDKYLSAKITKFIKAFYKDNFKKPSLKQINQLTF